MSSFWQVELRTVVKSEQLLGRGCRWMKLGVAAFGNCHPPCLYFLPTSTTNCWWLITRDCRWWIVSRHNRPHSHTHSHTLTFHTCTHTRTHTHTHTHDYTLSCPCHPANLPLLVRCKLQGLWHSLSLQGQPGTRPACFSFSPSFRLFSVSVHPKAACDALFCTSITLKCSLRINLSYFRPIQSILTGHLMPLYLKSCITGPGLGCIVAIESVVW